MERWEGRRADTGNDRQDKEVPVTGGDALGQRPRQPPHGGDPLLDLTGGRDDLPGGPRGGGGDNRQGGGKRATIGRGRRGLSALEGQDDAGDATSLVPPLLLLLLLLLSLLSSSAITEEHVVGGVPSSADADLDAIPTDKEDVIDIDNNGAMVAAVIATPDTAGGNNAKEAIVLSLLSSMRRTLISILLVIRKQILV
jgi:hypothetical protein